MDRSGNILAGLILSSNIGSFFLFLEKTNSKQTFKKETNKTKSKPHQIFWLHKTKGRKCGT